MDPPHAGILAADFLTSTFGVFLQQGILGAGVIALGLFVIRLLNERNRANEQAEARVQTAIEQAEARAQRVIDRLETRNVRVEEDNRRMYELMANKFVPALQSSTDVMRDAMTLIRENQRREELADAVHRARREGNPPHGD